jgi:hypothetical protein
VAFTSLPLPANPIVAQTTGECMTVVLPSLCQGLFRGKSLNRFSSFVTSGAEAYMLNRTSSSKPDVPPPSIKYMFEMSDNEESAPRTCEEQQWTRHMQVKQINASSTQVHPEGKKLHCSMFSQPQSLSSLPSVPIDSMPAPCPRTSRIHTVPPD